MCGTRHHSFTAPELFLRGGQVLTRLQAENWKSVGDYVRVAKLGFAQRVDADGQLCADAAASDCTPRTILLPNDFPYNFCAGIHHFVLWKIGGDVLVDAELEAAQASLRASHAAVEFSIFINPPHMQSIPEVQHAQILFATAAGLAASAPSPGAGQ